MTAQPKSMQELEQDTYLAADSYIESLYDTYLTQPETLDPKWRSYFDQLIGDGGKPDVSRATLNDELLKLAKSSARSRTKSMQTSSDQGEERIIELINAYRRWGHLKAQIDPLGLYKGVDTKTLEPSFYGFTEVDWDKKFAIPSFSGLKASTVTLRELLAALKSIYCGSIGFEYMHINRIEEVQWLQDRIEKEWAFFVLSKEDKLRLLDRLIVADGIEKYLGFKYVGQKRFSLEGGDSLIPLLDTLINRCVQTGVKETVIGMAHRGRLNVLLNVVGKEPNAIFAAFEGKGISTSHSGDVKYHLGYSSNVSTLYGPIHIALAFNPSHLEIVSPVVQGSVRARQRRRCDKEQRQVVPLQIHGEAAFSAQGVVMETFSMSQARWFTVGGSIHIVVNNQVGFTISDPRDSRSTLYATDAAKMIEPPILHVNGNDPEAIFFAGLLAMDYRQTFKRDAVIDLVCYRRHGHNEADEPSATQPLMYKVIKALPPPYQIYAKKLIQEGLIDEQSIKQMTDQYREKLDKGERVVAMDTSKNSYQFMVNWEPFIDRNWKDKAPTALPLPRLKELALNLQKLPHGFVVQPQVKKMLDMQIKMTEGEIPISWGFAETLAYASLLAEGFPIRLCGQDAARGTFAHRHSILHDQNTDEIYIPLSHVSPTQAQINIVDSLLSEEGVLAFEYGYATAEPNYLVIWEAQFGDFANGAQVVIDQFISSGEQKWGRLCGLVMLLPHGYEGQGPEHSSARLERYLQLCAQDNMQVCTPTTPAQIFHLIRRQMVRPYRKPLIIMSPKSLLRHPQAVSPIKALSDGEFQNIIPEIDDLDTKKITQLIFCCGKIYYELLEKRHDQKQDNIAIIRIEQLYPFPEAELKTVLKPYAHVKDIVWCQEEPQNQGAWFLMQMYLIQNLSSQQSLRYVGRKASASPAVGYHAVHEKEQHDLVAQALSPIS